MINIRNKIQSPLSTYIESKHSLFKKKKIIIPTIMTKLLTAELA